MLSSALTVVAALSALYAYNACPGDTLVLQAEGGPKRRVSRRRRLRRRKDRF